MTWSMNELSVLCAKAARGAGAPPAQASIFGHAALAHVAAGNSCAALADALAALPDGPIMTFPLWIAALAETAQNGEATGELHGLSQDPLLQSYLAAQPYEFERHGDDRVTLYLTRARPRAPVSRIDVPVACADRMRALAARILVPETAISRIAGAGAGLTDND